MHTNRQGHAPPHSQTRYTAATRYSWQRPVFYTLARISLERTQNLNCRRYVRAFPDFARIAFARLLRVRTVLTVLLASSLSLCPLSLSLPFLLKEKGKKMTAASKLRKSSPLPQHFSEPELRSIRFVSNYIYGKRLVTAVVRRPPGDKHRFPML